MGASNENIEFLAGMLGDPEGRQRWLEYKLTRPMMDLRGAELSGKDLRDFDFSDTDFSAANFSSADLTGADFSDANLVGTDFRRATMCNCCMDRADMKGANFQGATLSDACIEEASLVDARLQGADLVGADLASSDLTNADLRAACLKYTRMSGTIMVGANVAEADLTGSVMDDDAPSKMRNFDLAIVDDRKFRMMRSKSKSNTPPPKFARGWSKDDTSKPDATDGFGTSEQPAAKYADSTPPPVKPRRASDDTANDTGSAHELFGKEEPAPRVKVSPAATPNGATASAPPPPLPKQEESKAAPQPEKKAEPPPIPPMAETPKPEPEVAPDNGFSGESTTRRMAREYQGANFAFGAKGEALRAKQAKEESHRQQQEQSKEDVRKKLFGAYVARKSDIDSDEGCWRVLGVKSNPSFADVQKAYRNKCKIFHPDKVNHLEKKDQDFAREQFHLVKQAYEILARRKDGGADNIKWVEGVVKRKSPYEQTLTELIKLVDANPGHEALLYNLAYKYAEANHIDMAIRTYDRVLSVNPNNEDAMHNMKVLKLKKSFGLSGKA